MSAAEMSLHFMIIVSLLIVVFVTVQAQELSTLASVSTNTEFIGQIYGTALTTSSLGVSFYAVYIVVPSPTTTSPIPTTALIETFPVSTGATTITFTEIDTVGSISSTLTGTIYYITQLAVLGETTYNEIPLWVVQPGMVPPGVVPSEGVVPFGSTTSSNVLSSTSLASSSSIPSTESTSALMTISTSSLTSIPPITTSITPSSFGTTASSSPTSSQTTQSSTLSTGAGVGIAIGTFLLVLLLCLMIWIAFHQRRLLRERIYLVRSAPGIKSKERTDGLVELPIHDRKWPWIRAAELAGNWRWPFGTRAPVELDAVGNMRVEMEG